MTSRSIAIALAVWMVSGCASKPAYQASWFLVEDGNHSATMYLAILNQSQKPQIITSIVLNQEKDVAGSGFRYPVADDTWMAPGRVLVFPVNKFDCEGSKCEKDPWDCNVPVSVTILQENRKPVQAEFVGGMPNAFPAVWEKDRCHARKRPGG